MLNAAAKAIYETLTIATYRLIPSRFPPVSLYETLVANDRIDELVEVENLTNPRLQAQQRLGSLAEPATADRLQNWNHAPFAYSNPEGSLFFGPGRPCLELAADKQTALAISVSRRERFLRRTQEPVVGLDMRMLVHPVSGSFLDLRPLGADLTHDDRRKVGEAVPRDVAGILYHPAERPAGTCVAVLTGSALGRSVQANHYRFFWNGERMTKLYAFDDAGSVLTPEALASATDILAA